MKCISGRYNGTGAAVYIELGFIPDKVLIRATEDTDACTVEWSRNFGSAEQVDGIVVHTASGLVPVLKTAGAGIQPYEGGELLTASNQTSTTYGEGVYLSRDDTDYRSVDVSGDAIDTWTLDTTGNRTGHFNNDVVGTYIGEGSIIVIDAARNGLGNAKETMIEAVTAGQGITADEVTLSRSLASGQVLRITGKYGFKPTAIGSTTKAGFKQNLTSIANVNDEMQYFEAWSFDDN